MRVSLSLSLTLTHTHSHTYIHTHSLTHTPPHRVTHTHSHTHTLSHLLIHTHIHTHTHTRTHAHTHTHIYWLTDSQHWLLWGSRRHQKPQVPSRGRAQTERLSLHRCTWQSQPRDMIPSGRKWRQQEVEWRNILSIWRPKHWLRTLLSICCTVSYNAKIDYTALRQPPNQ